MSRLNVSGDEILRAYNLTSLNPQRWEDANGERPTLASSSAPAPSEEWNDPLGLRSTLPPGISSKQRGCLFISSKKFDPKVYLNSVHPRAAYPELSRGAQHLKQSIEQRSAALKVLVDENFDRFVGVKATTDDVFHAMSNKDTGIIASQSEQGLPTLRTLLTSASTDADVVFRPVLENYVKSMKLRSTLGVFQRSHFFFNLPGSLLESVEAKQYEAALRDYKKGVYLLETRPGQLLPVSNEQTPGAAPTEHQLAQQRRIFARVWDAVEDIMYDMQERLLVSLREPTRSVEEQEKCIEVLLELDPTTDPVAVFLESQRAHIGSLLRSTSHREQLAIQTARASALVRESGAPLDQARDLHECLVLVRTSYGTKPTFPHAFGSTTWQAIEELVASMCRTVLQTVPPFWRVARNHTQGKFSNEPALTHAPIHAQSKAWAVESIELFTSVLSRFFEQAPFRTRAMQPLLQQLPSWVPDPTCSLSATYYMSNILNTLAETIKELRVLAIPGTSTTLNALLLDTRFQFTEVLCLLWLRDAHLCHYLENWQPNSQQPTITSYLFAFSVFNRWNAREGFYLADVRTKTTTQNTPESEVDSAFIQRLKDTFVSVLEAFMHGIVTAAQSPSDVPELLVLRNEGAVSPRDRDTRILVSVSNLSHLRSHVIGAWSKQFEDAYHVSLATEQQRLLGLCAQLDAALLDDSVRRKGEHIRSILHTGILESGIMWGAAPRPSAVSPFIYQALLFLVQVHAQIRATVPALVSRVIVALVDIMADVTLEAYSRVHTFNMGGMLQATLEIEFVHQTMAYHVSPRAEATLKHVYETISQRYSASAAARNESSSLQRELEGVKHTLIASRKATALEFMCFRRPKTDKKKR